MATKTLTPFARRGSTPSAARPTPRASQAALRENAINANGSNAPTNSSRRILVVEDARDIAQLVQLHLSDLNYHVDVAYDGQAGLERALASHYDLIVLDLMLPGVDGLEICRRLRARSERDGYSLILMLTSKGTELDRVLGLEIGADDYLTKPFSIRELLARVKALFRRAQAYGLILVLSPLASRTATARRGRRGLIRAGELEIETAKRRVTIAGRDIVLTAKEFDLLHQFACHPGRVYTRTQLLDGVWGLGYEGYEHTVNSHINRLRAKIEDDPTHPKYLLTVWGVGYKFTDSD
jgi:DNA-binding response OmpR family regulator